jgi:hypothetical protein
VQIPETQTPTQDLLALITSANTKTTSVFRPDGTIETTSELDNEALFWETQNINSNTFGNFVKDYKDLESLKEDAFNHMCATRAQPFADHLGRSTQSFRYGVVGKSSETMRDKRNNQQNMIDKVKANKQQRVISVEEEAKRGLTESILGIEKKRALED